MMEPIVIWGAGAIGGTVGAYFQKADIPVLFVDNVDEHIAAINRDGLRIEGPIEAFTINALAATPSQLKGRFKTILLCTKAHHTEPACRQLIPHLAKDGCVVSLQNGLNERTIASFIGAERTVGSFINFGADYLEPGVIHYAGHGAVVVGELDGKITPRVTELHRYLEKFDNRAILTDNINGYLWSKMSYGALLYATALTNESIADVLASLPHRSLLIKLAREVLAIAMAEGIHPESFDGYDPMAFCGDDDEAAATSLDDLVTHNRRSAKTHSGIWRDLAVRKRPTEVNAQIGPMVEIAAEHNIKAATITRLITLIHDIETGRREPDMNLINLLGGEK